MTLNLTQADVGKVYVANGGLKYKLVAIVPEAHEDHQAVLLSFSNNCMATRNTAGKFISNADSVGDLIAEYKEPEVYEGWIALYTTSCGSARFVGSDIFPDKEGCLRATSDNCGFIDAIYIKHPIGEK